MNVVSIAGQLGEGRTRCAPGPSSVLGLAGRLSDLLALTKPRVMMRNALNYELAAESIDLLRRWSLDPEIGAIVVTGEGQAFCAGGDVSMMAHGADDHRTLEQQIDALRQSQELSWLLYNSPKVTIAAVNGHAMGASLGICPACDLRLAFDHARFGTAYANVELRRRFRNDLAARALRGHFQGQVVVLFVRDQENRLRCNGSLSHWIGQPRGSRRTPLLEVAQIASRIAHGPLTGYRYMKANLNLAATTGFRTMLDREAETHLRCGMTEDHKEGVRAFMEKRHPNFVRQ